MVHLAVTAWDLISHIDDSGLYANKTNFMDSIGELGIRVYIVACIDAAAAA